MDSLDSFEFNKMAGALLAALLFSVGTGLLSDAIFSHPSLEKPGYALPGTPAAGAEGGGKPAPEVPLADLLAKADPVKGQADTHP